MFLRLVSFDGPPRVTPELGPFAVVVIGKQGVEADGEVLTTGSAGEPPDVAFRTSTTGYHPHLEKGLVARAPAAPPAIDAVHRSRDEPPPMPRPIVDDAPAAPDVPPEESVFRTSPRRPTEVYSPPGSHGAVTERRSAFAPRERERAAAGAERSEPVDHRSTGSATLRSRIRSEDQRRFETDAAQAVGAADYSRYRAQNPGDRVLIGADEPRRASLDTRAFLWRWRLAIIGVLLVAVGTYAISAVLRGSAGEDRPQVVGISQRFSSAHWEDIVNGTQRTPTAGRSTARGVYYVVRGNVTNRGGEGAQLSPSDFVLIDANGVEYAPESLAGGAYLGNDNPQSPFMWPESFPVGRATSVVVIFDISPTLPRGMQLRVSDLQNTRVTLD